MIKVKKIIGVVLIMLTVLMLAACGASEEEASEGFKDNMGTIKAGKIDELIITSGADDGIGRITDKKVIKEAAQKAEELRFELDMEAAMTMGEMYTVKFMDKDKAVHQLSLDNEGVYWYDDTPGCYHVTEGDFSYDYVKGLYEENYEAATEAE